MKNQSQMLILLCTLIFSLVVTKSGFSQQKRFEDLPPKQQVQYLEQKLSRLESGITRFNNEIKAKRDEIKTEYSWIDSSKNTLRKSTKDYEIESARKAIDSSVSKIRRMEDNILRNQEMVQNYQQSVQDVKMKIQDIKTKASMEMNEKRIQKALERQEAPKDEREEADLDSPYTHAVLSIPESLLNIHSLKTWRTLQENERKCQYLTWKAREMREQYEDSKDTVAAVWDGGIPDHVAQNAFNKLKAEYDKCNRLVQSSGKTIRTISKKIETEMKEKGELVENFPPNEHKAWMSNNGKSVIIAKFISLDNEFVTLEAPNGKSQPLPLDRFWEEEQKM